VKLVESISLPEPTDATAAGPRLQSEGSSLTVEYDHEAPDGTTRWVRLRFVEVLAFEYRQAVCCDAGRIVGPHAVQRFTASIWLDDLLKAWNDAVGWHEWQKNKGGRERFSHFRVFFDDAGCLEVAAEGLEVGRGD
jgi:hypothetical protein